MITLNNKDRHAVLQLCKDIAADLCRERGREA